jgi:adenylate kinase
MAPIKDETVSELRDLVNKLEARVHDLETKLTHGGNSSQKSGSVADSIRMILIGPPGAGMSMFSSMG